jgi:hypothetical protein
MLSLHRYAAWITASLYGFITVLCLYFHFPWEHPSTSLDTGWFFIHFLIGPLGLVIYGGKIVMVERFKQGWGSQGLWWGGGLFAFWLIQYGTSILLYFNILRG